MAKKGQVYDIDASILIPHLRNLKAISTDHLKPRGSDDTRGIWVYGEPGAGKSHYARSFALSINDLYLKPQSKWWDGYIGQSIVVLDDLDSDCLVHHLKIWADKYGCLAETKGGTIATMHTHFIVTSNFRIDDLFEKHSPATRIAIRRRFEVVDIAKRAVMAIQPRFGTGYDDLGRSLIPRD